jgi:peptidoglycan glycosyltransferase
MPWFSHSRRHERRKRRLLTGTLIGIIFISAAVYLYGGQLRVYLLMNKGRNYLQEGNLDQALLAFNQVLKLRANDPQAVDAIGLIYLTQGDLVHAEIKYEQAIKLELRANRRFNHLKVGDGYLARGLYAPAELEYRHALDLTPNDAAARLGHALALHALGKVADAIDEYRRTLTLNPDLKLAQAKLNLARQELDRGFIYYIYDRNRNPLARFSILQQFGHRYYPLAQYGAHITGYTSAEHGQAGLERALASYLPGNTVTLTINADWQRAADRAIGWRKGSLVALDPSTGEILALLNHPTFNPNQIDEDWDRIQRNRNQPLRNMATEGLFMPGSIFKIITASAALESHIDLHRIFPVTCTGAVRYGQKTFWCWRRHGQVDSLQAALDTSCNLAMAEVGFNLGPDRLYEYSNKFGFGTPLVYAFSSDLLECSLPIATSTAPIVNDDRFTLAERSCGLGDNILITPLHAALLAATVANGGRMLTPFLIREIRNVRGEVLAEGSPKLLRTPISSEVAEQLKGYMIDTVKHGISTRAQVEGITVAGKTGTTGDSERGLSGWFICFAPAEHPKVAVAVYADREGTGMDVAAPIARHFLEEVLK